MTELIGCDEPGAPLCFKNGRLDVIQTSPSENTVFVQVKTKEGDNWVAAPGAYFVVPVDCYGPQQDMPFDLLHDVNWHLRTFGEQFDNSGFNYTFRGGARVAHAHLWCMQVQPGDDPAAGLYTTRTDLRTARSAIMELQGDLTRARGSAGSRPGRW